MAAPGRIAQGKATVELCPQKIGQAAKCDLLRNEYLLLMSRGSLHRDKADLHETTLGKVLPQGRIEEKPLIVKLKIGVGVSAPISSLQRFEIPRWVMALICYQSLRRSSVNFCNEFSALAFYGGIKNFFGATPL